MGELRHLRPLISLIPIDDQDEEEEIGRAVFLNPLKPKSIAYVSAFVVRSLAEGWSIGRIEHVETCGLYLIHLRR